MTKTISHPIFGIITYSVGDIYKDKIKGLLLPWEYRKLVVSHEERIQRLVANNYATNGLRKKDENTHKDELLIIDYWKAISQIRLDNQGCIVEV